MYQFVNTILYLMFCIFCSHCSDLGGNMLFKSTLKSRRSRSKSPRRTHKMAMFFGFTSGLEPTPILKFLNLLFKEKNGIIFNVNTTMSIPS